jgi:2-polyprenyl-6-methoxyphenol hydroxylase-like FAD-dependent oxidoreductase
MHRDEGIGYVIYPSLDQTEVRVSVGFGTEGVAMPRGDVAAQKGMVVSKCAQLGGAFPHIIEAMKEAPQFYYNELAQIRAPRWSKGRVVLAGDAAHCASPFSGQGTSLALVGALVLSHELARHPDRLADALAAYETRMRPFVEMNQNMVDPHRKGPIPDEVMTRSKNGIDLSDLLGQPA